MSEYIMHIAICDDIASVVAHAGGLPQAWKDCIAQHKDAMHLGSVTRGLDAVGVLTRAKAAYPGGRSAERIAYAVGRLAHVAADDMYKPFLRRFVKKGDREKLATVYMDLFAYREIYADGARHPFQPGAIDTAFGAHPGAAALEAVPAFDAFNMALQRGAMRLHTCAGKASWATDTAAEWQCDTENMRSYERHRTQPDPKLVHRFLKKINFYKAEDPILRWVRAVQAGKPAPTDVKEAMAAKGQSTWARTVINGYRDLRRAAKASGW